MEYELGKALENLENKMSLALVALEQLLKKKEAEEKSAPDTEVEELKQQVAQGSEESSGETSELDVNSVPVKPAKVGRQKWH